MSNPAIQTFGKYQILERIATGGMAEIYKARLEGIGGFQRTFAIKRILPNLSQNSEYIAMLVDEAKVAGLLSHANIVQILDLGQVEGIWYIAMEYVHGRDLGAVLRRAKKKGLCLPVPHTVFIAIELLKGLEYAHQRQVMRGGRPVALNIIHRDVSPPNVLLSFQGEVKLTDFGIARASLKAMETVSGIVKGRFDYMSPEQAAGAKDLDQRSDLFSVGVVLYEMLTGHHPFRTDNEIGTIERVRTGKYIPVSQRNPEVPFTLETIVDRALQVGREDRYPSATAFKEALDKFFHDAGFIFTHATLSSYVRGLFPEAVNKPGKATNPGITTSAKSRLPRSGGGNTEPVTGSVTGPTGDPAEGPTRRLDRTKLREIRNKAGVGEKLAPTPSTAPGRLDPDTATTGRVTPSPLADFLQGDEQETLIRKAPVGWEEEIANAKPTGTPRPQPQWSEEAEQETVIRKAPADLDEHHPGPTPTATSTNSSSTSSGSHSVTSSGRRTASGRKKKPSAASAYGVGVFGWVLAFAALFVGLIGGAAATLVLGIAAGFRYVPSDSPLLQPPRIEFVVPPNTQITVDGDAVGRVVTLEPDVPHRVEITLKDRAPWSTEVQLGHGETRVIAVDAATAPAGAPKLRGGR